MSTRSSIAAAGVALAVVLLIAACASASGRDAPLFRFGLVADVQYADKDTRGARRYREALGKLEACVDTWNRSGLAFAIQLGDLMDGHPTVPRSLADLDAVLAAFARLDVPLYHVIGNHCLSVPRGTLTARLELRRPYYDFAVGAWRFVVLDGMDVNIQEPSPSAELRRRVQGFLAAHPDVRSRLHQIYNGGVGPEQVAWLDQRLALAARRGERALVFCHLPIVGAAADPGLLLWNHAEVLATVERHGCVRAFFCGHHHDGGYALRNGIHHVTVPGMVNAPAGGNAFAVVDVYPDHVVLHGTGTVPDRILDRDPIL